MRNASEGKKLLGAMLTLVAWLGTQELLAKQPYAAEDEEDCPTVPENSNCPPPWDPAVTTPRCPWYIRAEGVMLMRDASGNTDVAALDHPGNIVLSTRDLDSQFQGGPRLLIGRTLNDWNQFEFSYFALQHGSDSAAIRDDTPNALGGLGNLASPFSDFGDPAVPGLDYNNFVSLSGKSTLDNAEFNWRHYLDVPPGRLTASVLVGARYMAVRERFEYNSEAAVPAPLGAQNYVRTNTANELFGVQLGALLEFFSNGDWWVNFEMKGAMCQNEARQSTLYRNIGNQGAVSEFAGYRREYTTAWVGDIALTVVYRFSPRLSARFGYQAIWVEGLALANENFERDVNLLRLGPAQLRHDGSVVYHGPFAGIELAW